MRPTAEYWNKLKNALKSPGLGLLLRNARGEKKNLLLLSLFSAVHAVLGLCVTLVMKELVDAAVGGSAEGLLRAALLLAGDILLLLGLGYLRKMTDVRARAGLLRRLRRQAMETLLRKEYSALQGYHSGELVNHLFSDVRIVADGILGILPPLLFLSVQLVGASVILYRVSPGFMAILLAAGALGSAAAFLLRNTLKAFHKENQRAEDKLLSRVQEIFANLRVVKAAGAEKRMEREADACQQVYTDTQIRHGRVSGLVGAGLGFIFRASWFYALIWGCGGILRGELTYGGLTAILQLVGQIQSPFEGLVSLLGSVYGAVSSAERLLLLYGLPDEEGAVTTPRSAEGFISLTLRDVRFSYEREAVLDGAGFTLNRGETAAVMGPSGFGKTTLFLLLLGIYSPSSGEITMRTETAVYPHTLRTLFAYVPQGNTLFSGTLRENLSLFCEDTPDEESIWRAAETACIADFIRAQEKGLDTVTGEKGLGLSEGQAQRVAIARALLTKRPVLLLDEATSALDEETEARLLSNIAALRGRTCLIVTHRKAALAICSRTLTLRDGRFTEGDAVHAG